MRQEVCYSQKIHIQLNSIEEWQDIILTELEKTNDILINTQT